jgi:hypothetical protein
VTIKDVKRTEDVPNDALTEIAGDMLDAFEARIDEAGARVIVLLDIKADEHGKNGRGGLAFGGFDHDLAPIEVLLRHARAIAQAAGAEIDVQLVLPNDNNDTGGDS